MNAVSIRNIYYGDQLTYSTPGSMGTPVLSKQLRIEFARPLFLTVCDKMTQNHMHVQIQSAIRLNNHLRAVLKLCREQSEPPPCSVSRSHVKRKKVSAEELSSF